MTADRPDVRSGFTLVEVAVTAFLLTASMTLTLHLIGWVAAERRASDRRQWASQDVANLMEHLTARPWDELTPGAVQDVGLGESSKRRLPGSELSVRVDEPDGPDSRRISLRLRWRNRSGTWEAPVRLTAWVYRRGGPR
jgi:hypothetical protein